MRREKPDCELKERVFRGETINGWDQGPDNLSARKATTSTNISYHQMYETGRYVLLGL
jgi:hypothetical protein